MEPIERLRALQELDSRRARLDRDAQRIPKEMRDRFAEFEAARLRLERSREEVKRMKAEEKNVELDMKVREEKLEKLRVQANMARDTATLLAANHQIQSLKDENSKAEDRALGLVDRIGELEGEFTRQEQDLAVADRDYKTFASKCEEELGAVKKELAGLDAERAKLTTGLDAELLDHYAKLFSIRGGVAVSTVEGDLCSGCSTVLLPNDLVKLRGRKQIIRCKSCGRILYLPPAALAADADDE
jgi:uncharacterized protein